MTPAQIAVHLICGTKLPPFKRTSDDMRERMRDGHDQLVQMTRQDFGYDLQAWHDYLKESRDGGYTYGRNIVLPKLMKAALESDDWQAAAKQLSERLQKQSRRALKS